MTPETTDALWLLLAAFMAGAATGLIGLVVYVIAHFVIKYW